jgi:thiol-disulfide isomerase/thioredoxin
MRPLWKEIETELPELKTEYFDADENPEIMEKYGIEKIPVFIFLDQAEKEILRLSGMQDKEKLLETIKEHFDK